MDDSEFNSIRFWSEIAVEAHRRDFTFDDSQGDDEIGTPMDRQGLDPRVGGPTRVSRALAIIHLAMFDALLLADPATYRKKDAKYAQLEAYLSSARDLRPEGEISVDAAVAGAASVVIQELFGGTLVERMLTECRVALYDQGHSSEQIDNGLSFGARIGREHLNSRKFDGSQERDALYRPFALKGAYRSDPFASPGTESLGVNWGKVTLFGGYTLDELTFVGPYETLAGKAPKACQMDDGKVEKIGAFLHADGWDEDRSIVTVKGVAPDISPPSIKGIKPRTAEETLIGIFWGYDGVRNLGVPPRLYNQCLYAVANELGLDKYASAILLSVCNMGMADAGIAAWHEKYTYHVGRPVTVLREIDGGFGPGSDSAKPTFGDALPVLTNTPNSKDVAAWLAKGPNGPSLVNGHIAWAPLGAPQTNTQTSSSFRGTLNRTPNFPAYPSGHATFGAACFGLASQVLEALGKPPNVEFTFQSDEYDGFNRDADGSVRPRHRRKLTLAQAIHENAWSRIYLGVHWRMDAVEGVRLGHNIASAIKSNGVGPASILKRSV